MPTKRKSSAGKSKIEDLIVRKATLKDARQLSRLNSQLGYPYTAEKVKIKLKQLLNDKDHLILVATPPDGLVRGWIHGHVYRLFYTDKMAEISGLVVDKNCRGGGIGKKLMQEVELWAKIKGCRFVNLRTNIIRKEAHIFYEKLGYKNIKTQFTFRKPL
jgi:GNAT superfamily N-acetyltransferase